LIAIVAMWLLAIRADYAARESCKATQGIVVHVELRDRIQALLWYVGVVIGGGVLATGMLRHAMIDAGYATEKTFPSSLLLGYGTFFTLLLVISYVPAHLLMPPAGRRVLETVLAEVPAATILEWRKHRAEWLGVLGLDTPIQDALKNTIAILAPILG